MRRRADVLTTLIFFVIVASLFPLGVGPEPAHAAHDGARRGVGRGAARLDAGAGRLFAGDYADGTLEQMRWRRSR